MKYSFGTITITEGTDKLVLEALRSTNLTQGKLVRRLEERFADLIGVKEAVAVSSGTDADILALASLYDLSHIKRGDEVIIPALSFVSVSNSVVHAGFKPAFVDIRRDTLNIDPDKIEEQINDRTRIIMPVHNCGKPADMDRIKQIASKYKLIIVEDSAEAYGTKYKGSIAGSMGELGTFSMYAAHIISSIEGGVITTNNNQLADAARSLRSHGRNCACKRCIMNSNKTERCIKRFHRGIDQRFIHDRIGYSSKMNELEAAVGLGGLDNYKKTLDTRKFNLDYLMNNFRRFAPHLTTFKEEKHEVIGPHALPILVDENAGFSKEDYVKWLHDNGIDTRDLFASIPTQYPSFKGWARQGQKFPEAEYVGRNGLHIGVHQGLTKDNLDYLLEKTQKFLKGKK
jgi:dTDP-4-amino-4,6-dideoxygalactose transaminase